jgi:juvenile hormone diol kinase
MLSTLQKTKLEKLLKFWDANNSGTLEEADYMRVAERLSKERGWLPETEEYKFLHKKLYEDWLEAEKFADTNKDKKISLDEWLVFCETFMNDKEMYDVTVTNVASAIIDAVDIDQNGLILEHEWQLLFRIYGKTNEEATFAYNKMSDNDKIKIDNDKVLALLHDFFYSQDEKAVGNYMFGNL